MGFQKSRKTTKKQKPFGSELEGLVEPTDQPPSGHVKLPFALNGQVSAWIVAHCLNGESFSITSLLQDLALDRVEPSCCISVVNLCVEKEKGLNLWRCDGLFLPCRENAAKAIGRMAEWFLRTVIGGFGFQDVPALVEAINALPSGLELLARDYQAEPAEEGDEN